MFINRSCMIRVLFGSFSLTNKTLSLLQGLYYENTISKIMSHRNNTMTKYRKTNQNRSITINIACVLGTLYVPNRSASNTYTVCTYRQVLTTYNHAALFNVPNAYTIGRQSIFSY